MSEKTEELVLALREYDIVKKVHDEEMLKCEYSWGYRGYNYIQALRKAEEAFTDALNAVIDERIEKRLQLR